MSLGNHDIIVGIASGENNDDTLGYCLSNGATYLIYEGKQIPVTTVAPQNGWKILVKVDRQTGEVEWTLAHPFRQSLQRVRIPASLHNKMLFPMVHLYAATTTSSSSRDGSMADKFAESNYSKQSNKNILLSCCLQGKLRIAKFWEEKF